MNNRKNLKDTYRQVVVILVFMRLQIVNMNGHGMGNLQAHGFSIIPIPTIFKRENFM